MLRFKASWAFSPPELSEVWKNSVTGETVRRILSLPYFVNSLSSAISVLFFITTLASLAGLGVSYETEALRVSLNVRLWKVNTVSKRPDRQPGTQDSFPNWGRGVSLLHSHKTDYESHPSSCSIGAGVSFPWGKKWPGNEIDHSLPASTEVKNMWSYTSETLNVFIA
jgi:hypothetical protein